MDRRCRLTLLACCLLAVTSSAQTRKSVQAKSRATQTQKTGTQKAGTQKVGTQKTGTQKGRSQKAGTATKPKTTTKNTAKQPTVKGLQSQRQQLQQQIKEQERRLQANRKNVKQRLENLQMINTEIADKRRVIDTIRHDLTVLDGNIAQLNITLGTLQKRLDERRQNYMKSMRYMHRNRSLQNQLMFIFSAHNFTQMYRRLRFSREYAAYQRAQGEAVILMQQQVNQALAELTSAKQQKNTLLDRGEQERRSLEGMQAEQQQQVNTLQKEQRTIQSVIAEQRKKDAALNAQIEKLIAEEVARAKARAEAEAREAKRKAAEAAAKKRAEELARKKAAAEAAARENARRIAEAKAREERAKAQAAAAAKKSAEEQRAAQQAAREAEKARREAERQAAETQKAHEREVAEARKAARQSKAEKNTPKNTAEDRRLSGNFESNRGRLPMPITGSYRIVNGFGQNEVEGLRGIRVDSKGLKIKGQTGAQARSIFDGEVCAVFDLGGVMGVMVRHGGYISVYSNLSSVSVRRGEHVRTRQTLGAVGADGILNFQLRNGSAAQNPARWLSR